MRRPALEVGFTGIGVQQAGDSRFIHLHDIQPEDDFHVPRPWIWSYWGTSFAYDGPGSLALCDISIRGG